MLLMMLFEQKSRLQTLTVRRKMVLSKLESTTSEMSTANNCQYMSTLSMKTILCIFLLFTLNLMQFWHHDRGTKNCTAVNTAEQKHLLLINFTNRLILQLMCMTANAH